jgi:hypothetical protein
VVTDGRCCGVCWISAAGGRHDDLVFLRARAVSKSCRSLRLRSPRLPRIALRCCVLPASCPRSAGRFNGPSGNKPREAKQTRWVRPRVAWLMPDAVHSIAASAAFVQLWKHHIAKAAACLLQMADFRCRWSDHRAPFGRGLSLHSRFSCWPGHLTQGTLPILKWIYRVHRAAGALRGAPLLRTSFSMATYSLVNAAVSGCQVCTCTASEAACSWTLPEFTGIDFVANCWVAAEVSVLGPHGVPSYASLCLWSCRQECFLGTGAVAATSSPLTSPRRLRSRSTVSCMSWTLECVQEDMT